MTRFIYRAFDFRHFSAFEIQWLQMIKYCNVIECCKTSISQQSVSSITHSMTFQFVGEIKLLSKNQRISKILIGYCEHCAAGIWFYGIFINENNNKPHYIYITWHTDNRFIRLRLNKTFKWKRLHFWTTTIDSFLLRDLFRVQNKILYFRLSLQRFVIIQSKHCCELYELNEC